MSSELQDALGIIERASRFEGSFERYETTALEEMYARLERALDVTFAAGIRSRPDLDPQYLAAKACYERLQLELDRRPESNLTIEWDN